MLVRVVLGGCLAVAGLAACSSNADPAPTAATVAAGAAACSSTGESAARAYADGVNSGSLDRTVATFADDAVVIDTGRRIEGRDAIRTWVDSEVMGGKLDLLGCTDDSGAARMLVTFAPGGTGGFKAYYIFHTKGEQISTLDLQYA